MITTRRFFTPGEANKTLPFVRRVIQDIVEVHEAISDLYARIRRAADEGRKDEASTLEEEMKDLLGAREAYVNELERVGCEFKDYRLGLVDFPARLDDRPVYLCWRMGEPEIQFWHEMEGGFAGRRPIAGCSFAAGSPVG
jgi:hypothetical protein